MFTQEKKQPALTDNDIMSFGKHLGKPMEDVPADYLEWLWNQTWLKTKHEKLYNYIWNSKEAIEQELGHTI